MRRLRLLPFFLRSMVFQSLVLLLPSFYACTDEGTPPPPAHVSTVQLSVEDASCTEAWLKVSLTDAAEPRTVAVQQDGQSVLTVRIGALDSVLVVERLLPRRTYSFVAQRLRDSTAIDASAPAQATTMDTTSHNFTWRIDTLGVTASSLSDVAIINDTLAYAVGEMYLRDSTGQLDPQAWNAAKWNGQRWELKRIPFVGPCSAVLYPSLKAIWAFSAINMLVTNGGSIVSYNGTGATMDCSMNSLLTGAINKLFATNTQDVYAVGNNGCIVRYNGSTWQRVESGTTLAMRDIWGALNPRSGQMEILALASTFDPQTQECRILKLTGNTVVPLSNIGLSPYLNGIWFAPGRRYYAVGAGIHQKRLLIDSVWRVYPSGVVTRFSSGGVRGHNINEVFVVGSFGEVVHYNGYTWHRYFSDVPLPSGAYGSVAVRNNMVMAVGDIDGSRAIVLIGRRH